MRKTIQSTTIGNTKICLHEVKRRFGLTSYEVRTYPKDTYSNLLYRWAIDGTLQGSKTTISDANALYERVCFNENLKGKEVQTKNNLGSPTIETIKALQKQAKKKEAQDAK